MQHARSSPFPFSRGLPARLSPYPPPPLSRTEPSARSAAPCARSLPSHSRTPEGMGGIEGKPLPLPQPNLPQGRPLPVM